MPKRPSLMITLGTVAVSMSSALRVGFATPNGAIRLAAPNTVEQYARDLYAALREGDARDLTKIAVILPEGDGLAEAIRDRITKAAHGD